MAKDNRRTAVVQKAAPARVGEGALIDVVTQPVPGPNGLPTFTVGINLLAAPVPERRFVADRAYAFARNSVVHLLIGQEKISGDQLRSMLVIEMGRESVKMFLESVNSMVPPTIKELMEASNTAFEKLTSIENEPEHTVAFAANLIAMAFTGQEACLDFYQASAPSMAAAPARKQLAVDPVVRVEMRLALADALVEQLRQIIATL